MKKFKAWYIVFINALVGCAIAAQFPQFSMTVYQLSEEAGISVSVLLASDTVKACGIVAAMLASGFIYNKIGARATFILSIALAVIPQFLLPFISSVPILMVTKFFQGTASLIFPVFLVIIMENIEEKDVGLATAIFNGIFYGGGGIGGTFAGVIIAKQGWVASYYAVAILLLALALIWLLTVRPSKPKVVSEEATQKEPLSKSKIALLAIAFFATTWMVQAITVDMPVFGTNLGYSDIELGKILTAVTLAMILACIISGKTSDLFARKAHRKDVARLNVMLIGYVFAIIGVLLITMLNLESFGVFYAAVFLFTFGASWGLGAFYCVLPEIYDQHSVPIVTGITGGIGDIGMPVSPLVVGVIFGVRGLWNIGWLTCAGITVLSALAIIVLSAKLKKNPGGF